MGTCGRSRGFLTEHLSFLKRISPRCVKNSLFCRAFDTNHFGDNSETCSKEYVISESDCMLDQCLDDEIKGMKKYKLNYIRNYKLKSINASVLAQSSKL